MRTSRGHGVARGVVLALLGLASAGCPDMADQPRGEPLAASTFFEDGALARPLVEGVVPRGAPGADRAFVTGREGGRFLAAAPVPITRALLERGRERYNIFCAVCHNASGDGRGMIVQRGFTRPPSFHDERLRSAPDGYLFDVITNGFGSMFPYAQRVEPRDRWAIAAYIRVLQLSQHAPLDVVPPHVREELERAAPTGEPP